MDIAHGSQAETRDAMVRWFHWINLIAVLGLAVVGTVIWNAKPLDISNDGKVLLKTIHVLIGYVFVVNLLVRLVWAFIGGPNARWRGILPGGRGYLRSLGGQLGQLFRPEGHDYEGHSPVGRLSVTALLTCMLVMACTGLVLAGTDIYYPPFGGRIAEWVAAEGVDPGTLEPNRPDLVNASAQKEMRAFRSPFIGTHKFVFFVLLSLVLLHVAGVVLAEKRGGRGIVSAMITGRRYRQEPGK